MLWVSFTQNKKNAYYHVKGHTYTSTRCKTTRGQFYTFCGIPSSFARHHGVYLSHTTPTLQKRKKKKDDEEETEVVHTQAQPSKLDLPFSKLIQLFKCQLYLSQPGSLGRTKLLKIKTVLLRLVFLPF